MTHVHIYRVNGMVECEVPDNDRGRAATVALRWAKDGAFVFIDADCQYVAVVPEAEGVRG